MIGGNRAFALFVTISHRIGVHLYKKCMYNGTKWQVGQYVEYKVRSRGCILVALMEEGGDTYAIFQDIIQKDEIKRKKYDNGM